MDLLFSQYVKSILVGPIKNSKKSLKLMSYLNTIVKFLEIWIIMKDANCTILCHTYL